jgi:hypothetical protein
MARMNWTRVRHENNMRRWESEASDLPPVTIELGRKRQAYRKLRSQGLSHRKADCIVGQRE